MSPDFIAIAQLSCKMNDEERDWKFFVDSLFLIFAGKQVIERFYSLVHWDMRSACFFCFVQLEEELP